MVLVADNAPYHHARDIGSLASLTKPKLVGMMEKLKVEYIDLPITTFARDVLAKMEGDLEFPDIQDRGECVRLEFVAEEQKKRAGAAHPQIGTLDELKMAFITYLKEEKPELLECKVEKYLEGRGHSVLWTPPYCPELQPIELFWAAGKITLPCNIQ